VCPQNIQGNIYIPGISSCTTNYNTSGQITVTTIDGKGYTIGITPMTKGCSGGSYGGCIEFQALVQ
jgi:hypothetical protein